MSKQPHYNAISCLLLIHALAVWTLDFASWDEYLLLAVLPDSRPWRGPVGAVNILRRPRPRQRSLQLRQVGAFDGGGSVQIPSRQRRLGATLDVVDASTYDLRDLVVQ